MIPSRLDRIERESRKSSFRDSPGEYENTVIFLIREGLLEDGSEGIFDDGRELPPSRPLDPKEEQELDWLIHHLS